MRKQQLISFNGALIIAFVLLGLYSCKKENADTTEALAAQSYNIAEVEDDNTQIMADQAESEGSVSLRTAPTENMQVELITNCAIVTRDTVSSPRVITIDFGTGCTNTNGVTRKGKIIVTYTGRYRDISTVVHITSENYFVNDNKVDIDRTVTNNGINDNGHYTFSIHSVRNVTYADGTTSSSIADKVREWTTGADTPRNLADDEYTVTGTATHTSRAGILYDATTLTPLIRKVSCHQFVSGQVKIIRHGNRDRFGTIDFGNGDCDDIASLTLDNGRTFSINLRH